MRKRRRRTGWLWLVNGALLAAVLLNAADRRNPKPQAARTADIFPAAAIVPERPDLPRINPAPVAVAIASNQPARSKGESCVPVVSEEFTGKCISVTDGDTLKVLLSDKSRLTVRLEGIDAPESKQDHGDKAKRALAALVMSKEITVRKTSEDRYGRTLGYIVADDVDVNAKLVEDGWAWHYSEYNCEDRFDALEKSARDARRGLWAHERPIPPWEYRSRIREGQRPEVVPMDKNVVQPPSQRAAPAEDDSTRGYWLNTSSGVRHNLSCQHFKNTKRGRECGPTEGRACGICGG